MRTFANTLTKFKNLQLPSRSARLAAAILVAAAPLTVWVRAAQAQSDTTAPVLSSLSADTTTINVDAVPRQVTISGLAQDDLSGFRNIESYFTSPSGALVYAGNFGTTGSPDENGRTSIYITVNFPQHTEPGTWRPHLTVYDETGNFAVLTAEDLVAAGFNLDIAVTSTSPDLTAPEVINLFWDRENVVIDSANGNSSLQATLNADDIDTGETTVSVTMQLVSPSGTHSIHGTAFLLPGDIDTFVADLQFPPYVEGGMWSVYVTTCDSVGNCRLYEPADLQTLELPGTIEVVSDITDTTPVNITLLDIAAGDPGFDTIHIGGAAISVLVEFSDDLSGLDQMYLLYRSQTTNHVSDTFGLSAGQDNVSYYLNATLPPYAASGLWLPEIYTKDIAGNQKTYTHQDLLGMGYDLSFTLGQVTVDTIPTGGTVNSDTSGDGATPADPVEASVATPVAGTVSVAKVELSQNAVTTPGYSLAGEQLSISAPQASPEEPLTLTFVLDASQVPGGQNAQTLAIFRNAALIPACQDSIAAIPDPCVFSRTTLPDGDLQIGVHTSAASTWVMGFPDTAIPMFQGFKKPVKDMPKVTQVEAGDVVPVKFRFGNNTDPSVLPEPNIVSQEIECSTKQPLGPEKVVNTNGNGVKTNGTVTKFNWKTLQKWGGTCRQLTLTFTNGEAAMAYFRFKD